MANTDQPIANPTYYQNIRAMFSQLDQVMMLNYFDLQNYDNVKAWANRFVLALQPNADPTKAAQGWSMMDQVHVMPEVPGPWPTTWVQTFKNWVAAGCPEGTPPAIPTQVAVPPATLQQFIALSKALTGIDDFGPDGDSLASIYYNRLLLRPAISTIAGDTLGGILEVWNNTPDVTKVTGLPIYKDIITIWYNSTTMWDNEGNVVKQPYYGTPEFNQYKQGLVWKVCLCHPMGYAPEIEAFYWQMPSQPDGTYTGLFTKNY